jgi:hypothetical protein
MANISKGRRKLNDKRKAFFVAQVLKQTGRLNLTEAHRRMYPNMKDDTHHTNAHDMLTDGSMKELERLLHITDPELLRKIRPEVIVQDIVNDLARLNELLKRGSITVEEAVKVLNAKGMKQKLLGQAIGIWKAEAPVEREKTASELIAQLNRVNGEN